MTPKKKIDFVKKMISEKAEISPSGGFYVELSTVVDIEANGGIPDDAPVLLSRSEQWSIIQKLEEEGYIQNAHLDEDEQRVWMEITKKEYCRSNRFSYIKTTDQLLQNRELFEQFIKMIGGINDVKPDYYYKYPTEESNDDLVQLLIDLKIVKYDWNEIEKQTHRQVGNRIIEFDFEANKVIELYNRISGKNGHIRKEALRLISDEIGNRYTLNKIVQIFTDLGVPETMFVPSAKWNAVFYVLSYYTTSESENDFQFALKIIEEILHPLMFQGDEEKTEEVRSNYRKWLKYDHIFINDEGKVYKAFNNDSNNVKNPRETDKEFKESLFRLRIFYAKILDICDAVASKHILMRNNTLNHFYTVLSSLVDEILEKSGFDDFKNEKPHLFESLIGDIEDLDIEWEYEKRSAYSFLGKIEKSYILLGSPSFELPEDLKIFLQRTNDECEKHQQECAILWQTELDKVDQFYGNNNKTQNNGQSLTNPGTSGPIQIQIVDEVKFKIQNDNADKKESNTLINISSLGSEPVVFDDDQAALHIGKSIVKIPPYKNEHFFCRAMFQYPPQEFHDWSEIYENMESGNKEPTDSIKNKRTILDTMYAVNKRVKSVVNTGDDLFTWKNKSIRRNY